MKHIVFEYKDAYSHGKWNRQECYVSSLSEAIKIYGLNNGDVEWRLVSSEDA